MRLLLRRRRLQGCQGSLASKKAAGLRCGELAGIDEHHRVCLLLSRDQSCTGKAKQKTVMHAGLVQSVFVSQQLMHMLWPI